MKQTLEVHEKLNRYIMYALFAGLTIITIISIAGAAFWYIQKS